MFSKFLLFILGIYVGQEYPQVYSVKDTCNKILNFDNKPQSYFEFMVASFYKKIT